MKGATITVRVSKELKEDLRRYGVNSSAVVRGALTEAVKTRRREDLRKAAGELGALLATIPEEKIVERVRETRRSR